MKTTLMITFGMGLIAGVASANTLHLWITEDSSDPGVPSAPTLGQQGDVFTLWAMPEPGDIWTLIAFDLLGSGEANMTNDDIPGPIVNEQRWVPGSDFTGSSVNLLAINTLGLGDPLDNNRVGNAYRLGTITMTNDAVIWFQITAPIKREGANLGEDTIIIGGQFEIASDDTSTVAQLDLIPEPTTLALLALASLLIRRR